MRATGREEKAKRTRAESHRPVRHRDRGREDHDHGEVGPDPDVTTDDRPHEATAGHREPHRSECGVQPGEAENAAAGRHGLGPWPRRIRTTYAAATATTMIASAARRVSSTLLSSFGKRGSTMICGRDRKSTRLNPVTPISRMP